MTGFGVGVLLGLGPTLLRLLGLVLPGTTLLFVSDPSVLEALPVREAGLALFFLPGFVLASVSRVAFLLCFCLCFRPLSGAKR